ncbi:MAG TPA: hypothetical protein PLE24_14185 [Chitinispirillaceae bacterium]|nr:hypothetical protein [Chitinispirillaceae bacterium]
MSRGPRQSRNPVEKLQEHVSQLGNIVEAILESAEKPDFVESVLALKRKKKEGKTGKADVNKEAKEVGKLLQMYPGLSKQVLGMLRSRIGEYKELGVIEKYKV